MDAVMDEMIKNAKEPEWLEQTIFGNFRAWQIIFLALTGLTALIIALCCCIKFRVPRTKQQIEADYQRRVITKKFREQLERIQNSQMDMIDLKISLCVTEPSIFYIDAEWPLKDAIRNAHTVLLYLVALDLVRAEFKSDTDSEREQQSASLISSITSPVPSSEDNSYKSTKQLNGLQELDNHNLKKPSVSFSSKIAALVKMSKQRSNEPGQILC